MLLKAETEEPPLYDEEVPEEGVFEEGVPEEGAPEEAGFGEGPPLLLAPTSELRCPMAQMQGN